MYVTALILIIFLLDLVAGGRLRAAVRVGISYGYVSLANTGEYIFGSGFFTTQKAILAENEKLRTELELYQRKDAEYAAEHDENARLRTLVNIAKDTPGHAASIISSLYASAYGTFTIDVGINDAVSRGNVVFTPDGYAIGTVSETSSHTSLVTQLFAPDATIEAIVGATHIVLLGQGGGNARARAPRESTISEGDVVRGPIVDAPIGIVEHVESSTTGADKVLYVRIPANLSTLTLVYVGRK